MKDSRAVVDGPGPGLIPGGGVERVGPRQSPGAAKGDGPKATGPSRAARARENQAGTPPRKRTRRINRRRGIGRPFGSMAASPGVCAGWPSPAVHLVAQAIRPKEASPAQTRRPSNPRARRRRIAYPPTPRPGSEASGLPDCLVPSNDWDAG